MTTKSSKDIKLKDDKAQEAFRKLLLAKQLYLHGLEHSNNVGAIDKMIAVHNFHNAIEIVLKAIILHFDIRPEKQLDIDFRTLINEISKYKLFKENNMTLPYQREILNLNQLRNSVQHHGFEPEASTMDYWRVYTRDFLEQVCQIYFEKSFDALSPVDMISDVYLRELLRLSLSEIEHSKFDISLKFSKIAFEWARMVIIPFLPDRKALRMLSISSECKVRNLKETLERLEEKSDNNLYFSALLSSGIKLVDYNKFQSISPEVHLTYTGNVAALYWNKEIPGEADSRWAHDFVVNTIIRWQSLGLKPCVPDRCVQATQKMLNEQGIMFGKSEK